MLRRSLTLRLGLDLTMAIVIASAFTGRYDPDAIFHIAMVIITVGTFLHGFRGSLPRIGVLTVAVIVYSLVDGTERGTPPELAGNLLVSEWPLMLAIMLMVAVMADREMTASRRYAGLYRRAADQLMTAQEDERLRLARDLHDGVGQSLTAIALTLDAAATTLDAAGGGLPATIRGQVDTARDLAATALEDTRDVATRLRPTRLAESGLAAALEELAARAGAPVTVTAAEDARRPGLLEAPGEVEAFRIVQEAVANAARHAHATWIRVGLAVKRGSLIVDVTDDGVGFVVEERDRRSLGIAGMRERAAMIGGDISITSRPGSGTTVRLVVPLVLRRGPSEASRPGLPDRLVGAQAPHAGDS